ncbi:MAG TPA: FAD-binding oxidoreductase [Chitinispirillaceae bacterium]|nr:FAD-binding oxidoreductase [Chitinispirillaceae bacterium]
MRTIIGSEIIQSAAAEFLHDESRYKFGVPDELYFPESINDVCTIVANASNHKRPIHFIGARTGTTGGSNCSGGSIAISFSSMNRIIAVEKALNGTILLRCQPGVRLDTINTFLLHPDDYPEPVSGKKLLTEQYIFAPDPTEKSAYIGGMVACNASGARSFRFGAVRDHIRSCKIVISGGDLLVLERGKNTMTENGCIVKTMQGNTLQIPALTYKNPEVKNAAGYYSRERMDIIDLVIGSEGTLGAIVEIAIELVKAPDIVSGLSFFPSRSDALGFVSKLRKNPATISIEYFDPSALDFINHYREKFSDHLPAFPPGMTAAILWEWNNATIAFEQNIDTFESHLVIHGSSLEATWSPTSDTHDNLLQEFRHALPEAINAKVAENKLKNCILHKIGTDTAVPPHSFNKWFNTTLHLLETSHIPFVIFGHIGDCHPHINLLPEDEAQYRRAMQIYEEIMKMAADAGGTISAEHGIGKLKKKYLALVYNSEALKEMRAIKSVFDPYEIFNPGNLL